MYATGAQIVILLGILAECTELVYRLIWKTSSESDLQLFFDEQKLQFKANLTEDEILEEMCKLAREDVNEYYLDLSALFSFLVCVITVSLLLLRQSPRDVLIVSLIVLAAFSVQRACLVRMGRRQNQEIDLLSQHYKSMDTLLRT